MAEGTWADNWCGTDARSVEQLDQTFDVHAGSRRELDDLGCEGSSPGNMQWQGRLRTGRRLEIRVWMHCSGGLELVKSAL